MKNIKKTLAVLLSIVLVFTAMPMVVTNAAEDKPVLELDTPVEVNIPAPGATADEADTVFYKFAPENDGWYRFYSTGNEDPFICIYNSDMDKLDEVDDFDESYNFSITKKLYAGYTYYIEVGTYSLEEATFMLTVKETAGVESIEITNEPDNKNVIEYYEEDSMDCSGLEAKVTMTDGTEYIWSYDEDNMVGNFYVYVDYYDDGQGHYYIDVVCEDVYDRFFFTTIENPVESIEYSCDETIEIYENTCGYYDEYDEQYYYYYEIPESAIITINYKDGRSVEASLYELVDGVEIYDYDTQDETPWVVGSDNYVFITYLGVETKVPVTLLPCPFINVTVDSAPVREYVFGDEEYGELLDDGTYYLYPGDLTGLSFTVEYADGSKKQYDDKDINTEHEEIDGYIYTLEVVEVVAPGIVQVTLNYKNYDIKYNVTVLENPIEKIEILSDPKVTEYDFMYDPIFDGMQIKITYKDETSKIVTLSDENTDYFVNSYVNASVIVDDYKINIAYDYYDEDSGIAYYIFSCLGVREIYDGIKFTETRHIDTINVDKFTANGDGMVITVTYTDGIEETLNYDMIDFYDYGDGYLDGYARTENGIAYYEIESEYENENFIGYYLYALNKQVFIPAESYVLGDVDGDEKITIMDATYIQRHLAKLETLEGDALLAADTYKDGQVSVLDASQIQRLVAKLITEF